MTHAQFDAAVKLIDSGEVDSLRELLKQHPDLANARDEGNASLLIRLIDWPGYRPRSVESARVLLEAGVDINSRRDDENGTALAGALYTEEFDLVHLFLEFGADIHAPLGWMSGTNLDLVDRKCQDLGKQRSDKIRKLADAFSKAAGRAIPSQAPFGGTVSLLFVNDIEAGLKFYTEKLGFHVNWTHTDSDCDPYISISRGSTEFHLTGCGCDDNRHVGNLWVRVECDLIDDLYEQVKAANVTIFDGPANQPWGFRELDIEDPEGNRITFYGPTTEDDSED